jgi:hypothetical protein
MVEIKKNDRFIISKKIFQPHFKISVPARFTVCEADYSDCPIGCLLRRRDCCFLNGKLQDQ